MGTFREGDKVRVIAEGHLQHGKVTTVTHAGYLVRTELGVPFLPFELELVREHVLEEP